MQILLKKHRFIDRFVSFSLDSLNFGVRKLLCNIERLARFEIGMESFAID